jgi:hypothetical protein
MAWAPLPYDEGMEILKETEEGFLTQDEKERMARYWAEPEQHREVYRQLRKEILERYLREGSIQEMHLDLDFED